MIAQIAERSLSDCSYRSVYMESSLYMHMLEEYFVL